MGEASVEYIYIYIFFSLSFSETLTLVMGMKERTYHRRNRPLKLVLLPVHFPVQRIAIDRGGREKEREKKKDGKL